MFREWKRGDYQKKLWSGPHQGEQNEEDLKLPGRKGLEDCWGERGNNRRRLEWQRQMEEKDKIIVKWAKEDVETSNNVLNKL